MREVCLVLGPRVKPEDDDGERVPIITTVKAMSLHPTSGEEHTAPSHPQWQCTWPVLFSM
jgi:hypothetical protein